MLTAVLLGGVAFTGGRGSMLGVTLGVLFIHVLANGFTLWGLSTDAVRVANGARAGRRAPACSRLAWWLGADEHDTIPEPEPTTEPPGAVGARRREVVRRRPRAARRLASTCIAARWSASLGDNGAGKSTLVKCIAGTHTPDAGEILVDGEPVTIHHPDDARALGIETVFQELALVDTLDVPSNLFSAARVRRGPGVRLRLDDRRRMERETAEILDRLGDSHPSLRAPVGALSGGQRQSIAVGRAVAWGRHIVLLDEPAAALGVEQAAHVLELVERLHAHGVAVVLISHNMQHVLEVCSRVVVLRHGRGGGRPPGERPERARPRGLITGADVELRGV